MTNRNASATIFGFQFQTFVGIMIALRHINEMRNINIEGPEQDVEVQIGDNMIYCQAKSCFNFHVEDPNNTNWPSQLFSGLDSLFEDYCKSNKHIKRYIYATNYPYPLGIKNNCGENFGEQYYGLSLYFSSLNPDQMDILRDHLTNCKSCKWYTKKFHTLKKKYNSDSMVDRILNKLKDKFFNEFKIITYNFKNPGHPNDISSQKRKLDTLYHKVKVFLDENLLSSDVDPEEMGDYWRNLFFDNSTYENKIKNELPVVIDRQRFLMSIYAVNIASQPQRYIEGTHVPLSNLDPIIRRFRWFVEYNENFRPFVTQITNDSKKYLGSISDGFPDASKISKFVKNYESNYEKFFKLDKLPHYKIQRLTEYALTDWLTKRNFLYKLLKGHLKNVD